MTAYPQEYRERARSLYRRGISQRTIARVFGVSKSTVARWCDPHMQRRDDERRARRRRREGVT